MWYQSKPHAEIHRAALIQHWDIQRSYRKSLLHKFSEHTGERTSSKTFFCLKLSEIPVKRKKKGKKNKTTTWAHCLKQKQAVLVDTVLCNTPFIPACPFLSFCFVFGVIAVSSSVMEFDNKESGDLHWKLTTHFLPAMPRKYFSVRSHTSCSSGREERQMCEKMRTNTP